MRLMAIVFLSLLILGLLAGLCIFCAAFRRGKAPVPHDSAERPEMVRAYTRGKQWFLSQPYQRVEIESDELTLQAYYLPAADSKDTLLLMHGYHAEALYEVCPMVRFYHELGYNLLIPDQRAHCSSDGKYLSFGILERRDVRRWCEMLCDRFAPNHIFLGGVSMGGATVLMSALEQLPPQVRGIIADCPFADPAAQFCYSLRHKLHLPATPFLYLCGIWSRLLAGFHFTDVALSDYAAVTLPLLVLHGTADPTVPHTASEELMQHWGGEKQLILFEGCAHAYAAVYDPPRYFNAVTAFLQKYSKN